VGSRPLGIVAEASDTAVLYKYTLAKDKTQRRAHAGLILPCCERKRPKNPSSSNVPHAFVGEFGFRLTF
jgi:hypothetical protein